MALALVGVTTIVWLKAAAHPTAALSVATAFVERMQAKRFSEAFALTMENILVGRNPAELEQISNRQFCSVLHAVGTWPPQSNGNRIEDGCRALESTCRS